MFWIPPGQNFTVSRKRPVLYRERTNYVSKLKTRREARLNETVEECRIRASASRAAVRDTYYKVRSGGVAWTPVDQVLHPTTQKPRHLSLKTCVVKSCLTPRIPVHQRVPFGYEKTDKDSRHVLVNISLPGGPNQLPVNVSVRFDFGVTPPLCNCEWTVSDLLGRVLALMDGEYGNNGKLVIIEDKKRYAYNNK